MIQQLEKQVPLSDITVVIKTFERPASLERLIRSVRKFYPDLHIVVADDSFYPRPRSDVEYIRLAPDTGVAAGRNALLRQVRTPLFLTLDDDFEFTKETRIERLAAIVASGAVRIAAGNCLRVKRKLFRVKYRSQPYFGLIEVRDQALTLRPGYYRAQSDFFFCDIVPQFFVADLASILAIGGWDPQLKTNDHQEFFVRVQRHGFPVAYCPTVTALHWHTLPKHYARFRHRDHRAIAARKMGVTKWTEMDGRTFTFIDSDDAVTNQPSDGTLAAV